VDFENELRAIPGAWDIMTENHPERPEYNVAPIGTAVLWMPFYLAGHAAVLTLGSLGVDVTADGISSPYAMAVAFGSSCLVWLGMLMVHGMLRRHASPRAALFATLLLWLASPLLWYLTGQPWMSHAASFFAGALVLWTWWTPVPSGDPGAGAASFKSAAALGGAIGLAMLVRPSHVVLLVLPLIGAAVQLHDRRRFGPAMASLCLCLACALAVFSLQLLMWFMRYGFETPPGSPMRWASPAVVQVLFSAHHGLFAWHPALLFGFVGIPFLWRRSRKLTVALALVLAGHVYMNAAVEAWYAGGSFGMRRFVGVLPFMAPGMAAFGSWIVGLFRKRPTIPAILVLLALFTYNDILMLQIRQNWTSFLLPLSFQAVWSPTITLFHERFGNPFTYPASLWFALEHRVSPAQYDVVGGSAPNLELNVEGAAMKPYLGKGWLSSLRSVYLTRGAFIAENRNCTLLLYMRPDRAYDVHVTLAVPADLQDAQVLAYSLNGTPIGTAHLPAGERTRVSVHVPAEVPRDGVNTVGLEFSQVLSRPPREYAGGELARGLEVRTRHPLRVAATLWRLEVASGVE
jgi:hypothetical protein